MLLHIFQIVKFPKIKAKYNVIEPYYMEGTTPDQRSFGSRSSKQDWYQIIITLNNTSIDISFDFNNLILKETKIFQDTKSTIDFLKKWCCNEIKK